MKGWHFLFHALLDIVFQRRWSMTNIFHCNTKYKYMFSFFLSFHNTGAKIKRSCHFTNTHQHPTTFTRIDVKVSFAPRRITPPRAQPHSLPLITHASPAASQWLTHIEEDEVRLPGSASFPCRPRVRSMDVSSLRSRPGWVQERWSWERTRWRRVIPNDWKPRTWWVLNFFFPILKSPRLLKEWPNDYNVCRHHSVNQLTKNSHLIAVYQ